jgi:hypothetical protein
MEPFVRGHRPKEVPFLFQCGHEPAWFFMKRSISMLRTIGCAGALLALVFLAVGGTVDAAKPKKTKQNLMVKGTIKLVDPAKNLLIVNQKVKQETVDRELSISEDTEFVIMKGKDKQEVLGREGLELLVGKEGARVKVKCDKDVNVLKVTVNLKK